MLDERLGQVEKLLSRYREQLYGKELAFGKAPDEDKARIKLQISDLKEEMQPYIQEYWDILSSQSTNIDISEEEAEIAVAEIVKNTNTIELAPSSYPSDVLYLLREIRDKLNQPISHKLRRKSSCQGRLEEKTVTLFLPFRKRCND
jgi:hypothetical protein